MMVMVDRPSGVVNICGSALAFRGIPQMALATAAAKAREASFLTVIFIGLLPFR
jgi:hypothetical protein